MSERFFEIDLLGASLLFSIAIRGRELGD